MRIGPAIIVSCAFGAVAVFARPPQSANALALVGTWAAVPPPFDPNRPPPLAEAKVFTETTWSVTQTDLRNGVVPFHHGGTYTFDGTKYSETVTFANTVNLTLIGRRFDFTIKPDERGFVQTGLDNRFSRIYRRLVARDPSSHVPARALACEPSPEGRSALLDIIRAAAPAPLREVPTMPPATIADYAKVPADALVRTAADTPDVANLLDLARCHYAQRRLSEATAALARGLEMIQKAKKTPATPALVKVKDVPPAYPAEAADVSLTGAIVVEASIDRQGRVKDATILRSIPLLDDAALAAVRQWEFSAVMVNGSPVEITAPLVVTFGTPRPTDDIDAGRFLYARGKFAEAEAAVTAALARLKSESR